MRDTFTRDQHVALDELHRLRIMARDSVVERPAVMERARNAGLSYAEIGEALGISRQRVHQLLANGGKAA